MTNVNALHLTWIFTSSDAGPAQAVRNSLDAGHRSRLFDLMVWDFRNGQADAILALEAPLEAVVSAIWNTGYPPVHLSLAGDQGHVGVKGRPEPRAQSVRTRQTAHRKQ